jgi:O-antigen ligase/polysaccharide polymerase Wzy-like membrane protein
MNSAETSTSGTDAFNDMASPYQEEQGVATAENHEVTPGRGRRLAVVPATYLVMLLLLSTWWQGAFELQHWAPLTLFSLAVIVTVVVVGGVRVADRRVAVGVAGLWGLAAWGLLSATWADSPGDAIEDTGRCVFYAAVFTVILTTLSSRPTASALGRYFLAGLGLIAAYTLVELHADGENMFLAGRLDGPVNYRNGTAALFGVAVLPAISYAAARGYNPVLRSAAFTIAVLSLGLAFLTQSRGVVFGLAVGLLVALACGPDRVRRAWLAVLAVAIVAAASGALLAPYHAFDGAAGTVTASDIATAVNALTLVTAIAFATMFLLAVFDGGLRPSSTGAGFARAAARFGLIAGVVVVGVVGLVRVGNPVSFASEKVQEFRNLNTAATGTTRLSATGGQRYDIWRIAVDEFKAEPLRGVGLGSYRFGYYRQRATDRNLSDSHGLPFKLLSETGLIGLGLFVVFLIGVAAAGRRAWGRAVREPRREASALAAAGIAVLAQASVDWTWIIPGVMALSFVCLALATAIVTADGSSAQIPRADRPLLRRWLPAAAGVLAVVLVLSVYASDLFVRRARQQQGRSPAAQLSDARTAGRLDPWSATPLYLQAGALEDLRRPAEAQHKLEDALQLEPQNFVTIGLLGDFKARQGNKRAAALLYRRALALNPRDVGLRKLAAGEFGR